MMLEYQNMITKVINGKLITMSEKEWENYDPNKKIIIDHEENLRLARQLLDMIKNEP